MKPVLILFLFFLLLSFLAGIYFCMNFDKSSDSIENMEGEQNTQTKDSSNNDCPNLLMRSGNAILLYNTNIPESPGTNPIPFFNLDEYINYLEIQRKKGIHCPVLYLQEETNTQGQNVYRIRPSPFRPEPGLPQTSSLSRQPPVAVPIMNANDDNLPYNANNYNGFDPYGQQIGVYTELDKLHDSTSISQLSENPMDENWGGVTYTRQAVDSGKYAENEVVPPTQKTMFSEDGDNIKTSKQSRNIFA